MSGAPLRLGVVGPPGVELLRSGLRWVMPDGAECRAGDIVAYCNVSLSGTDAEHFAEEEADLQIALALPRAGRIRHARHRSRGGYVDRLPATPWMPEQPLGFIEGREAAEVDAQALYIAGRRFAAIAEDRSGMMTGWHDRVRAWWGAAVPDTLLAMGTCEQAAFLRGSGSAFGEMFAEASRPLHLVLAADEPLVPNARICLEQLDREAEARTMISRDLAATFFQAGRDPRAAEWLFLGGLLRGFETAPLDERHAIFNGSGVHLLESARHLSLSLSAEFAQVLRHRRLGYTLNCHHYRLRAAGAGVLSWLRANFDMVERSVADVRADYEALLDRLAGRCTLFVVNICSSQSYERTQNYRMLDPATYRALGSVRAKQLNLMLHDLARTHDLRILDQDAIAAELGMAAHVPDGTHASGALNARLRSALLDAMALPAKARRRASGA